MSGRHKWEDVKHKGDPARVAALRREMEQELTLAELRRAREMTQKQLADALEVTQPGVSAIEKRTDLYVSTLRSYVEALGGHLEITAVFKDGIVPIKSFAELDDDVVTRRAG